MSNVTGIQGQMLEVRVAGCNKLKNTKWITKQYPSVCIEYGGSKFRSRICTDEGTNPNFQEKFLIPLVEGIRELNVEVWNTNTVAYDNLIGSGTVQLRKVLSEGFDDAAWTILSKTNRHAGEVCLIMHYPNANKSMTVCASPAPQYCASPAPQYCAAPHPLQPQPQPQPQVPQYYAPPPPPQPQVPQYYAPPPATAPLYPLVHPPSPYTPQPTAPQPETAYPPLAYAPQGYPPQGYPPSPSQAYPSPY